MNVQAQATGDELARYLKLVGESASIVCHLDVLRWLQGDLQQFLPHDILLAGWGRFEDASVQHDVVSSLPGARSYAAGTDVLPFLLSKLHSRWVAADGLPITLDFAEFTHLLGSDSLPGTFTAALRGMNSVVVHGLKDKRGQHDCLYLLLKADKTVPSALTAQSLTFMMPHIDAALRRVTHLPQQQIQAMQVVQAPPTPAQVQASSPLRGMPDDANGLSERETEIMAWVAMGKTNSEIGSILNISGYTVKNHMQRIFHKLNVFNRTQAVSKVTRAIDV